MGNTIILPANYLMIPEEEMTYTEGGATAVQALCAWVVPFYGWIKGLTAVRDYRRAHPDTWLKTGAEDFIKHMHSSVANWFYDVGCAFPLVTSTLSVFWIPINLLFIMS